jgi:hypothetical protein
MSFEVLSLLCNPWASSGESHEDTSTKITTVKKADDGSYKTTTRGPNEIIFDAERELRNASHPANESRLEEPPASDGPERESQDTGPRRAMGGFWTGLLMGCYARRGLAF